jgi:hypothetical protein
MTRESIHTKALDLQDHFNKSKERLELWKNSAQLTIARVLRASINEIQEFKCSVNISQDDGQEFVNVTLANQASVNNPAQFRKGGMLTYLLTHRGKVLPVIVYPFVEGQVEQGKPLVIGNESIEPSAITKELIWQHFETFLDEMLKWETNASNPIGFKIESGNLLLTDEIKD